MPAPLLRPSRLPLALALALSLALAGCGGDAPEATAPATPELALIEVAPATGTRERSWDGVIEAVDSATLSAQTRGRVLELPFDVNDYVEEGQVLVRFTDVEQVSGQRQAEAALAAARAAAAEAEADYTRTASLVERQLVARAQLDQAIARRDAARAQLASAQAGARGAGEQVDYTVIRAPYSGILTERHVRVGEAVQPGQPLVSGLSLDRLRVSVQVPQGDVAAIREHASAALLLDDGRRVPASEVIVFPYADPATHAVAVRVELPGAQTGLQPGMAAKVAFKLGEAEALRIPDSALVRRSEVAAVYVVTPEGRVQLRQVRPGHRADGQIEILAGLNAGERIAADPIAARAWLAGQRAPAANAEPGHE